MKVAAVAIMLLALCALAYALTVLIQLGLAPASTCADAGGVLVDFDS
jgi:hypothetical protein